MPNLVHINQGVTLTWDDSGTTEQFDVINLVFQTGWNGALHDFGLDARPRRWAWRMVVIMETAPLVDETIDVYWKTSDGTNPDMSDADNVILSSTDKLKNLLYLGSVVIDSTSTTAKNVASGTLNVDQRFGAPVIFNNSAGDNMENTADASFFTLSDISDEIQ